MKHALFAEKHIQYQQLIIRYDLLQLKYLSDFNFLFLGRFYCLMFSFLLKTKQHILQLRYARGPHR